jgi:hypothetical protein
VYLKNFPRVAPTTLAALLGALLFLEPLRGADLGTGAEEEAGPRPGKSGSDTVTDSRALSLEKWLPAMDRRCPARW